MFSNVNGIRLVQPVKSCVLFFVIIIIIIIIFIIFIISNIILSSKSTRVINYFEHDWSGIIFKAIQSARDI